MSYNKNKKSVAESIINGNYNANDFFTNDGKQKKSVSESIINGTYNAEDFFPSSVTKKTTTTNENKSWISNLLGDIGNIGSNVVKSAESGLLQFGKTISMRMQEGLNDRANIATEQMENLIEKDKRYSDEEKEQLLNKLDQEKQKNVVNIDKYQEKIDTLNREMAENTEKTSNGVSRKIAELSQSIGNNLVGMGVSAINPGLGMTYFTGSATGSYYDEAKQRGMEEDDAKLYAGVMGAMEGITEKVIAGENIKGVKAILNGSGFKSALKSFGIEIGENFLQEAVIPSLSELTTKAVAGNKYLQHDYTSSEGWKELLGDSFSDGIDGALSSIILGGATRGIASSNQLINKIKSGEKVTQQEVKTAVQDAQKSGVNVEEILQEEIKKNATNKIQQQEQISPIIKQEQNGTMAPIETNKEQNIENKQNLVYNVNSESEDGVNDGYKRDIIERGNRLHEEHEQQQNRQYSWEEYNKWEQSIKPIETNKLTNDERQSINRAKTEYNKDVYLYDENVNDNTYSGGASQIIEGKITISRQSAEQFGLNNMIEHENIESDILHNDKARDILSPVIDYIMEDTNFNLQKESFWKNQKGNIPTDYLIAKDIICDRFSEIRQNQKLDYDNVLSNATNSTIDNALSNYYYQVYGKELENSSSFNFQKNEEQSNIDKNTNLDQVNPYRNVGKANKLIKEKNAKITTLENDLKNVESEEVKKIIKKQIKDIEKQYNEEIQKLYDEVNEQNDNKIIEEYNPTRHDVIQKNREIARKNIENISTWKDKKIGLNYQLETMERNMYDIIPNKEEAKKIIDTYFEPIHKSEAKKQRFINKYNDRISKFNLNKYESEAAQLLGEQKYNPEFDTKEAKETIDRVNKNIEKGKIDENKVNNAIEEFRMIYDELFETENNALTENGYQEIPYRKGYFPHFIDYVPETKTEKFLKAIGFNIDKRALPTDIAGITEQFVPGKTWNKSALQRKTNKTDYNALKGFDTYISQAADNIFHTENIQRLRGLENEIRYQYSDKGIQERIDNIINNETLFEEEKQNLIDEIFKQKENPMPNLVTELRRYTNALANKKSEADRSIENKSGRQIYSTINAIESRFGANAVGLNIGSAVTNFIPIAQAYSQVSTKNMGRAIIDTMKSYAKYDGFVDKSTFLTNRLNQAEKLYKTSLEKISDKTSFLFTSIDEVTSNIVVRGKYLENIADGMTESEAMANADRFAANVMGDRSKGAIPTIFEEKNPIAKTFAQFQLEVNNQYRYMFKDLPRDLAEKGLGAIALAFFKMFVASWLYNEASEKITGRRSAFDPIDIISSGYKDITDDNKKTYDKITSIGKNVAEEIPFVGGLIGGGRIPINGALPDVGNLAKSGIGLATGEMDSKKAISNIGKELSKPLYYLAPPFGGAQIKKSVKGINTVKNGGSYGIDSKGNETLQFPVENANVGDYLKAGIFGKYALPLAKDYIESGYKSLNAKQTKSYQESKIPYKEYLEFSNQKLITNEDKIDYISKQNWGEQQKWGIYINEIFSSTERIDGGSQLEDAKYITSNGISKSDYMDIYNKAQKNNIDMPTSDEYKELKSSGINLEHYIDYKTKVHNETAKQKKSGELKDAQTLSDKDKMKILLNTNYSNKEKKAIYTNAINSKDKKIDIISNANISINEYLKYRTQNIESDKDSNGKTISNSKKKNTISAINKLNLSIPQKAILIKSEYSTYNDYNNEIVKYVKGLNIAYNEKKSILENLNMTVSEDGTVSWKK